ncbi:zinc finger MYND domain-containing protein 10 [Coccinella septempunctata]|uniref:zinc finger MYND domain-containing protein 10 n=1 Tax=Coccinella septempunctata TaxID=41139 RepID=UPI001D075C7B|nr:zinc finger MYND domain-containing protein 10 [Coccinella septempunctata]
MDCVLLPTEVEFYIDTMKIQNMENIGSHQWLEWHKRLQKLNQEAMIEASAVKEEYVKETLISFNKVNLLIHEAILINIWKHKVLPQLLKMDPYPESTMVAYSVLYHEAVCVSLLELVTFHSNCCEALEDNALELLDYCCGNASRLLSVEFREAPTRESPKEELDRQRDNLVFDIGIKCLSIIRYLCETMDRLPLAICSSIYTQYDIPTLFIEILRKKPWIKGDKYFVSGKWREWDGEIICPSEAQTLLTLRHILLDQECPKYYQVTESRRAQLLSLLSFLTPVVLDQLSPLIELKYWLNRISIMNQPASPPRPVLLEPCLVIKEGIMRQTGGNWKEMAKQQLPVIFCNMKEQLMENAKILNDAYNIDLLEKFDVKNTLPCARCGKDSTQRCSRCKKSWYCSRKCQVTHWQQHKEDCTQVQ